MIERQSSSQLGNEAFEKKIGRTLRLPTESLGDHEIVRQVAANLGEVELHLDKPWEAAAYLAYNLRTAPPSAKPAQRERTKHFLDEAKAKVGTIRLRLNAPGALVSIEGKPVAADDLPHDLFIKPGTRTIEAKHEGYTNAHAIIEVKAGSSQEVTLTLTPLPVERRSLVPLIAMGAASVIGLGVGVATTVISNGKSADADAQGAQILKDGGQCAKPSSKFVGPCGTLKDSLKALDKAGNIARGAYIASGALALGAVVYALLPQPRPTASGRQVRALPMMGAGGGGVVVIGAW